LNGTFNAVAFTVLLKHTKELEWRRVLFCFAVFVFWPLAGLKA
jgi:hypothetical protein